MRCIAWRGAVAAPAAQRAIEDILLGHDGLVAIAHPIDKGACRPRPQC
jgi:hypothetical protein